ncbi:T9SS type A sorting domain-containing protein [Flavobacteriaceae bacterium GSB9]|nr:T9SS type A sorting domain-containing protein [Flavobacteriaceae bacterium GSB9]
MAFSQITFNGCHPLFEDQDYVFNLADVDDTGRNIYITAPLDGEQACGGIGTCEFKIAWSQANNVWEFLADDGNGNFTSTYVIYTNVSDSKPNPPSLTLGTWVENNGVTLGECGGDLNASNATLMGDVQDELLSFLNTYLESDIYLYPIPAKHSVNIQTTLIVKNISVLDISGHEIVSQDTRFERVDVTSLPSGIYFFLIETGQGRLLKKVIVK